jgi:hypothetical protein
LLEEIYGEKCDLSDAFKLWFFFSIF